MTKLKNSNCEKTKKRQNVRKFKSRIVTEKNMLRKLKGSNYGKNYNTKIVTKIQTQTKHKLKFDKTLKLNQQQNSKTNILTTQSSNCDQTNV